MPEVVRLLRAEGVDAPVVVGGIIPEEDRDRLTGGGVAAVYTPKDFELGRIMDDIADPRRGPPGRLGLTSAGPWPGIEHRPRCDRN